MAGQLDPIQLMRKIAELEDKINAMRTIEIGGVWQNYTVEWTATTNPSIGDGSLIGRYSVVGKICFINMQLIAGSTTTFGAGEWMFGVPFAAAFGIGSGAVKILDNGSAWHNLTAKFASATQIYIPSVNATYPMTWAVNDSLNLSMFYEI